MHKAFWLAGVAAAVIIQPAMAQTVPVADQGVLVFEPAFFAAARPNTALDMVSRLPGFSLDSGDSDTRGLAGASGNVLIDGQRPSSKTDELEDVLNRISAASVARVELIRGGAPGIDMQGRPVVANIVLIRTAIVERVIEGNAYFYPDGHIGPEISAQYSSREGDNQIEGSITATADRTDGTGDGYRRRYSPSGALIQDADLVLWDRYRSLRATGAIQRRVGDGRLRVNGLLRWYDTDDTQDLLIRSGAGAHSSNVERSEALGGEIGANWSRDIGPRTALELTGLHRWDEDDYAGASASAGETSAFTTEATSGETIGRGVIRFRPSEAWAVEAGGEVAYNVLDSANTYQENGVDIPLPSGAVKVEELRGEVFGQSTWRPDPRFTLEFGIRVEVSEISQSGDSNQSKSFVYPKPRIQATWTPRQGHQFRFRLEREVGQLDFEDFAASSDIDVGQVEGGNPDLEPQRNIMMEALYERRFWDEGVFDVTVQHALVEDVIDIIPLTGGFDGVGNIGDGTTSLFQFRLAIPLDRLGVSGGRLDARTTWMKSSVIDPLTGEDRRFIGDQSFGCEVNFTQDLAGGRWSWGIEHGCNADKGRTFRVREVRRTWDEPFVTVYGQWKPRPGLTVRADIGNATDRERGYDRDIYSGPRDVSPLAYRETRRTKMSPWIFLQVRRTF